MTSSDPRFSRQAWLRFEGVVAMWLKDYPNAYVFQPSNFALETTIARLRDAVKAKLEYGYESPIVDHQSLADAWPNVVVSRDRTFADHIRIGTPLGRDKGILVAQPAAFQRDGITTINPSAAVLNAFCLLINAGELNAEVHIKNLDPALFNWFKTTALPAYPNISHIENGDTITII